MFGKERSSSSSSGSSRKGKKSSNSDGKPKQPQRGLGVAQLEKIRLHGQLGCTYNPPTNLNSSEDLRGQTGYTSLVQPASSFSYSSSTSSANSYGFHPNVMMGFGEMERLNIRYDNSQTISYNHGNGMILESQDFAQPNITRHLLNLQGENSLEKKRKKSFSEFMGSNGQNSQANDTQELDLELRLSL